MKRLVMGTLTAALITGSFPLYEINAETVGEAVILSEEGGNGAEEPENPSVTENPQPTAAPPAETPTQAPEPTIAPTQAPVPTQIPVPSTAPAPTEAPVPTEAPAPTQAPVPENPTDTPSPELTAIPPSPTQSPTATPEPTITPAPAQISVSITADPADAEILLLDEEGNLVEAGADQHYSLTQGQSYELYVRREGYQEVHETFTADPAVTEYTITLLSSNTALKGLYISSSDKYGKGILKLSPELAPDKEKYEASYDGERQSLNIWPEAEDEKATVKVYAISGVKAGTVQKDETIAGTKDKKDRPYWKIFFADQEKEAKVRLEVTAEDGTQRDYYITLTLTDTTAPVLKKISASRISTDSASAVYKTSEKGICYYQVIDAGGQVPALDTSGSGTEVSAGTNTISLTGLTSGEKDLVVVVKDIAGNVSDTLVMRIPDIKAGTTTDLVHGSDHGGNKSQATIPGQSGEGSLSNLKLVEGTRGSDGNEKKTTGEIKASLKPQNSRSQTLFQNLSGASLAKDAEKTMPPEWTDRSDRKLAKDLKPGYTIAGEKIEEKLSEEQITPTVTEAAEETITDQKETSAYTKTSSENQTRPASASGTATRGFQKASLLTKILLVLAGIEAGFVAFFAAARRRFRKGKGRKKKPEATI